MLFVKELWIMIWEVDIDGDGRISFFEFVVVMMMVLSLDIFV